MQPPAIRTATLTDLPTLLQFEQGVIIAERPFDSTLEQDPIHYYDLHEMIAAQHIELVVAEANGVVIGSGYARIEAAKPYLQHRQHAYLSFMYVMPQYRGQGVNKAIIKALVEWCVARGITEFRLDVYHSNGPAIKAYEKAGFSPHMLAMRKGLR